MISPALTITGLTKRFGSSDVLKGIDLTVPGGSMLSLVGESGSGKSTLLRIVAGLERADAGSVLFGNQPVGLGGCEPKNPGSSRAVEAVPVGLVFQKPVLYPHLTLKENILFAQRLRPKERLDRDHYLSLLDTLGLGEHLDKKPGQLSGGQAQRAGIARALVRKTPLVLFDEPLSSVDTHLSEVIRADVLTLHRTLGFTGLYVTHTPDEAMQVGQKIAVLEEGRLSQVGPAQELLQNPASLQVARLIHPLYNELPAELSGKRIRAGISAYGFSPSYRAVEGSLLVTPRSTWGHTSGTRVEAVLPKPAELRTLRGPLCLPAGTVITAVLPGRLDIELGKTMHWLVDRESLNYF